MTRRWAAGRRGAHAGTRSDVTKTYDRLPRRARSEKLIVTRLIDAAVEASLGGDSLAIINLYVSLKSKPMAILTGPARSGKVALLRAFGNVLTAGDHWRFQEMVGHPWWASQCPGAGLLAEAQTLFSAEKMLALIEEACLPQNTWKPHIACLTRISRAEWSGLLSELAFQLRHGQLMRLATIHFEWPIPFPPNVFIVATMDTTEVDWADEDLLCMTNVLAWPANGDGPLRRFKRAQAIQCGGEEVQRSLIRDEGAARLKLRFVLGKDALGSTSFPRWETASEKRGAWLPTYVRSELVVYLANAWTEDGTGLFHPSPDTNAEIALDWALAQIVLPRMRTVLRKSPALLEDIRALSNGEFPQVEAFLEALPRANQPTYPSLLQMGNPR